MNNDMTFMPGDKVRYIGSKFSSEIGNKIGEIDAKVYGSKGYTVTFLNGHRETGEKDCANYICSSESLVKVNK
jgi:hypothetical protein